MKMWTVAEVAAGLGISHDRVLRWLQKYTGPVRRGRLRELTPEQVWGAVQFLGIEEGGSWYRLSRRQLTRRIGIEYPFTAERTRG